LGLAKNSMGMGPGARERF